jgi:hypothetical protein
MDSRPEVNSIMPIEGKEETSLTGAQKKSDLLGQVSKVQMEIRALGNLLKTSTPNAAGLIVTKDIEKLLRAAEKAQMGLQELVL